MYPSDEWLMLLNFYLIVNSGGDLSTCDFDDARLAEAYQENPGERLVDMDATALKLALEFQAEMQDTELENSLVGEKEEILNGSISIPVS